MLALALARKDNFICASDLFWSWIFLSSRRSSSTGTLDGDPIYCQELKLILSSDLRGVRDRVATTRVRHLEFSEFPIFWSWFVVTAGGRIYLGFVVCILVRLIPIFLIASTLSCLDVWLLGSHCVRLVTHLFKLLLLLCVWPNKLFLAISDLAWDFQSVVAIVAFIAISTYYSAYWDK